MLNNINSKLWGWLGLVLLTAVFAIFLPNPYQQLPVFLLLWVWPLFTWGGLVSGDWLERGLLGAGIAITLNSLGTLLIHYVPGSISAWALLGMSLATALLPLLILKMRGTGAETAVSTKAPPWKAILIIFLLSLALRAPNISFREVQGDEAEVLQTAARSLTGDLTELFAQRKGPGQALLPVATWGIAGEINDAWLRLPFLWINLLSVLVVYALARRWFDDRMAFLAGLLYAVAGLSVAFSRVIQYQNQVIFFGLLAMLTAVRYTTPATPPRRRTSDFLLTAVFLATGLLAHFDVVLMVPAVLWLLVSRIWREKRLDWSLWLAGGFLGSFILALFFLPYARSPRFAQILSYLLNDRVGLDAQEATARWSLADNWHVLQFYNSTYFMLGVALLILLGLIGLWLRFRQQPNLISSIALCLLFFVPAIFYLFIAAVPGTHFYTMFPGAVILAAVGLSDLLWRYPALLPSSWQKGVRGGITAVFLIWIALITFYLATLFVMPTINFKQKWADTQRPLYPATLKPLPRSGYFGFPEQAGWRALPNTVDQQTYTSNEKSQVTSWYLPAAIRTQCPDPQLHINAKNELNNEEIPPGKNLATITTLGDQESIFLYQTKFNGTPQTISADHAQNWVTAEEIVYPQYVPEYLNGTILGDQVRLLGYEIDDSQAPPDGQLIVTLYWQPLTYLDGEFSTFVHLVSNNEMLAQHDSGPQCNQLPTSQWKPGQIIHDPHIIPLSEGSPNGNLDVLVGMYAWPSLERLNNPNSSDGAIHLPPIVQK